MTRPYAYARASDERDALRLAAAAGASFIAGGTDFLQLWKAGIDTPDLIVDISRLPFDRIEVGRDLVVLGALARLADVADNLSIRRDMPVLADALLASASPQLRNMATIGGNLMQRTRCPYFRGAGFPCNKRAPGSGCGAIEGENRLHAIFGASSRCVATHPSDLAVALVALGASVRLRGPNGDRRVAVEDFFLLPGDAPERETVLAPGELIVAIEVPRPAGAWHSGYLKVRDRASFEFAVVSAAVAAELRDGRIADVRIAAGGVGTKPWRLAACEAALAGAPIAEADFYAAAARAGEGARPLSGNGFKVELLRRTVHRLLLEVLARDPGDDR
jgi:xanthine dehydrogenase YagS FAD-binding subunit